MAATRLGDERLGLGKPADVALGFAVAGLGLAAALLFETADAFGLRLVFEEAFFFAAAFLGFAVVFFIVVNARTL
jgi:hypothetical protein